MIYMKLHSHHTRSTTRQKQFYSGSVMTFSAVQISNNTLSLHHKIYLLLLTLSTIPTLYTNSPMNSGLRGKFSVSLHRRLLTQQTTSSMCKWTIIGVPQVRLWSASGLCPRCSNVYNVHTATCAYNPETWLTSS